MSEEDQEVVEISYTPIAGDDPFGVGEMLAQGASALDLAAVLALEKNDYKTLVRIGREWGKLAKVMAGIEIVPEENKKVQKFGFSKEEEERDGKSDKDNSTGKDDIQSRGRLRSYRNRSR